MANVAGFTWFTEFKKSSKFLTRIRACEQLQKFCEHEQASTRLSFASKSSKGQILRAVENFYDHSIPLIYIGLTENQV